MMSDENVANLYPYQDKNKYGEDFTQKNTYKIFDKIKINLFILFNKNFVKFQANQMPKKVKRKN